MELKICCLITEIRKLYELYYISTYTKQTKKRRKSNQSATQDLGNKLKGEKNNKPTTSGSILSEENFEDYEALMIDNQV